MVFPSGHHPCPGWVGAVHLPPSWSRSHSTLHLLFCLELPHPWGPLSPACAHRELAVGPHPSPHFSVPSLLRRQRSLRSGPRPPSWPLPQPPGPAPGVPRWLPEAQRPSPRELAAGAPQQPCPGGPQVSPAPSFPGNQWGLSGPGFAPAVAPAGIVEALRICCEPALDGFSEQGHLHSVRVSGGLFRKSGVNSWVDRSIFLGDCQH